MKEDNALFKAISEARLAFTQDVDLLILSQPGKTLRHIIDQKNVIQKRAAIKREIEFLSERVRRLQGYLLNSVRSDERRCLNCLSPLPKQSSSHKRRTSRPSAKKS